jgi:hypothetical protein
VSQNLEYRASCHCGKIRFSFKSEPITKGARCNCSICVRKGVVMSDRYYKPESFLEMEGADAVGVYEFGDHSVGHCFCTTCGIHPFNVVTSIPEGYTGPTKPGERRVNLGCVHDLDVFGLEIRVIDGRSL